MPPIAPAGSDQQHSSEPTDAVAEGLLAVTRLIERGFNSDDWDVLDEIVHPDVAVHVSVPMPAPGREGWIAVLREIRQAFEDAYVTVDDIFVSGDRIAREWTFRGTHTGDFLGVPPTGRTVRVSGVDIERVEGSRIVEHWSYWDELDLMRQLGLVPGPATGPTS